MAVVMDQNTREIKQRARLIAAYAIPANIFHSRAAPRVFYGTVSDWLVRLDCLWLAENDLAFLFTQLQNVT